MQTNDHNLKKKQELLFVLSLMMLMSEGILSTLNKSLSGWPQLEVLAFGQLPSGNTGKIASPGRNWWTQVGIPEKAFFYL